MSISYFTTSKFSLGQELNELLMNYSMRKSLMLNILRFLVVVGMSIFCLITYVF